MASVQRAGIVRAVAAATIGTIIEWFDFALYGAAAGLVINKLFFPADVTRSGGTMAAFATFAVASSVPAGGRASSFRISATASAASRR